MGAKSDRQRERDRLMLAEFHPEGPVQTGFAFAFRIEDDPPRIRFDLMDHDLTTLLGRVWFETPGQFREFADLVAQVARDAGCYMPSGIAMVDANPSDTSSVEGS